MKTIEVALSAQDGLNVLNSIEDGWYLVAKAPESGRQSHMTFLVQGDASVPHEIRLNSNGSWSFKTEIEP